MYDVIVKKSSHSLSHLLISSCYFILGIAHNLRQSTDFDNLYDDVFPCKEVPFGCCDETAAHLESQIPKNPNLDGMNGCFQTKAAKYKTCTLSTLLYRFQPNSAQS